MGISPRVVTEDVTFLWDGVPQRLPKGQVIDVAPGSALERAIGAQRLVPLPGAAAAPPVAAQSPAVKSAATVPQDKTAGETPYSEPKADTIGSGVTPPKPAVPVKKQDTGGDP